MNKISRSRSLLVLLQFLVVVTAGCTSAEVNMMTPSPTLEPSTSTPLATITTGKTVTPIFEATPSDEPVIATLEVIPGDEPVIVFSQQGGIAGIDYQWSIFASGRVIKNSGEEWLVDPEQVTALMDAIEQSGFLELSQPVQKPICCDFFTYTLAVRTGAGMHEITLTEGDPDLPAAFSEAIMAMQSFVNELNLS